MARLKASLKKLIGRVIEKMPKSEYFMMVAFMAIPLGVILLLQNEKLGMIGIAFIVAGMLSWLIGIPSLFREDKKRDANRKVTNNLIIRADALITAIINELQGLRSDINGLTDEIKKERNGRNDSDK